MSLEPSTKGWTFDTLKQYIDAKFTEADKRYEQRFMDSGTAVNAALQAAEKAVTKAEAASEKRFESVNEFRGTLTDQARTFIPRAEADLRMGTLEAQVRALTALNLERRAGGAGMKELWGYIIGIIGIIAILSKFFIK